MEASAINSTEAKVVFNKAVKEVKPANFKVTDKDGDLVFISQAKLDKAKKVATLTFFNKFKDKETYTVEISNVKDAKDKAMKTVTKSFEFLAADIVSIEFTGKKVVVGSNLIDVLLVKDALGRDVTKEATIEYETSNSAVVDAAGIAQGAGSAMVVAKVEDLKTASTAITVEVAKAGSLAGYYVYETAAEADTKAFNKLDEEKVIDYVYENDSASKLAVYYLDQFGKDGLARVITFNGSGEPTLENMTPAVVIVENDGTIKPQAVGTGYVKVTNGDLVSTAKIVVRAKAEVAAMELDKTNIEVVKGLDTTVKVTFKDQYGAKVDKTPTVKSKAVATATAVAAQNKVTITGVKEGSTTVTVSFKLEDETLEKTINVVVVKAGALETYEADVDAVKIDVSSDNSDDYDYPNNANVVVNKIDENGNKIGTAVATLTELDKDGEKVTDVAKQLVTIASQKATAKKAGTAYIEVKVDSYVVNILEIEVIKSAPYAKTVEFNENAIVKEGDTIGTLTSAIDIDDALLTSIVTVKDQYGDVKTGDTLVFTFSVTNLKDITYAGGKVTELAKVSGTADIVITKVVVSGETTNLISENEVIKLSVKASEQAIADKAKEVAGAVALANVANADINTEAAAEAHVESLISQLDLYGASYEIEKVSFTAAVAGSSDGSYVFKVNLTKGAKTASTANLTLTIDQ